MTRPTATTIIPFTVTGPRRPWPPASGILICGTGVGIGIAAGKVKGIRVCTCSDVYSAELSKRHNNSNILTMGARVVGSELAKMIARHWLTAEFEGGRHQRRVEMIERIENGEAPEA